MYKIPLKDIKEKIVASGKLDLENLESKIKEKINELSGLISEEGAAHIIANELNIELVDSNKNKLKIKEIYSGMKNVSTVGKVTRKFEIREFAKGDRTGKVASLIIGDDTGTIRIVFWNEQADLLNQIKEDDILLINDFTKTTTLTDRKIESSSVNEVLSSRNLKILIGSLFLNRSEKTFEPFPLESINTSKNKRS